MSKELENVTTQISDDEGRGLVVVIGPEGLPHAKYVKGLDGKGVKASSLLHTSAAALDYAISHIAASTNSDTCFHHISSAPRATSSGPEVMWVIASANAAAASAPSEAYKRIKESASEMLKDPKKVRAFFARVNGEASAS
ncbi:MULTISPECIES: hypothetical protein [unclassified Pseudomonas]|uniref:hypothetical protein n=1 Tax=unclassified Pseudomonas TaxID=196821 RepID=UPI0011AF6055|nr:MULTISPECIES: hypothetical protein [unclassified Pseudomonas]